jgi:hypothetical protein
MRIDPSLHPLWVPPKPRPKPKPKQAKKPRRRRIEMGPLAAAHIMAQTHAIAILWRMLELVLVALDDDDPDYAREITAETIAELERVLVFH